MARPKRVFTDSEVIMIAEYALNGGKNNTIASALKMPVNTLTNRFSQLLKENRAIRKLKLAANQTKLSKHNPAMAIFLGKNELDQVDKQVVETEATEKAKLTDAEAAEARKIANILNLEDARKGKAG